MKGVTQYTYFKDVEKGMTVVDVGSGPNGGFSIYAAKKGAEVFAIEPESPRYSNQVKNIVNSVFSDRIISVRMALWCRNQELYVEGPHIRASGYEVQGVTLDKFVKDFGIGKVDFVKIDTEGCELPILAGAKQTIKRDHPIFSIAAYHERHYTVNGKWIETPPPPTITKKSQMDAIIKYFKKEHSEYSYTIKEEGWASNEIVTLFVE